MKNYTVILLFNPLEKNIYYVMKGEEGIENNYREKLHEHQYSGKVKNLPEKLPKVLFEYESEQNVKFYDDKIRKAGCLPVILTAKDNLSESAADALEMFVISQIGRINMETGGLYNLCPGGKYKYPVKELNDESEVDWKKLSNQYPEIKRVLYNFKDSIYVNEIYDKYGYPSISDDEELPFLEDEDIFGEGDLDFSDDEGFDYNCK